MKDCDDLDIPFLAIPFGFQLCNRIVRACLGDHQSAVCIATKIAACQPSQSEIQILRLSGILTGLKNGLNEAGDSSCIAERVLPHAKNSPSFAPQDSSDFTVTCFGSGNFRNPEIHARFWHPTVPRAAVPEAAINKDGDAFIPEHKVRFSRKSLVAPPTLDAVPSENRDEPHFGRLVAA